MDERKYMVSLDAIAARLSQQHEKYAGRSGLTLETAGKALNRVLALMFPHYQGPGDGPHNLAERLAATERTLVNTLTGLMASSPDSSSVDIPGLVAGFLAKLPEISSICYLDAQELVDGDPAATTVEEVILSYPGFFAVAAYRLAHELFLQDVPLVPRLITEYAHQRTGIDIHPGARIGRSFYIDHGTSVVIGETAVIGNNVKLYQGVTLGGLKVDDSVRNTKRHPTIEDNVVIYANATILGGDTVVGANSIIGGNVWLTRSVAPWSRVMFKPCDTEVIAHPGYKD